MSYDEAFCGRKKFCKICGKEFRVWSDEYVYRRPRRHISGEDFFCSWTCLRKADRLRDADTEYPHETDFRKEPKAEEGKRIFLRHNVIKGFCHHYGITITTVSREIGMNANYVSYVNAQRLPVQIEVAEKVADFFGVSLKDIATETPPPPRERRERA